MRDPHERQARLLGRQHLRPVEPADWDLPRGKRRRLAHVRDPVERQGRVLGLEPVRPVGALRRQLRLAQRGRLTHVRDPGERRRALLGLQPIRPVRGARQLWLKHLPWRRAAAPRRGDGPARGTGVPQRESGGGRRREPGQLCGHARGPSRVLGPQPGRPARHRDDEESHEAGGGLRVGERHRGDRRGRLPNLCPVERRRGGVLGWTRASGRSQAGARGAERRKRHVDMASPGESLSRGGRTASCNVSRRSRSSTALGGAASPSAPVGTIVLRGSAPTCTAKAKAKRVHALRRFLSRRATERAAFFRTHRSPSARKAFPRQQQVRLHALRKAAACKVVSPHPPPPPRESRPATVTRVWSRAREAPNAGGRTERGSSETERRRKARFRSQSPDWRAVSKQSSPAARIRAR